MKDSDDLKCGDKQYVMIDSDDRRKVRNIEMIQNVVKSSDNPKCDEQYDDKQ